MQYLYYTLAAIALYFLSDWILLKLEQLRGKPFAEQRSLVFLLIIMLLAVSSFKIIELAVGN
jgi:hypothetical protein